MNNSDVIQGIVRDYRWKYSESKKNLRLARGLFKAGRIEFAFIYLKFAYLNGDSAYSLKSQLKDILECNNNNFRYRGPLDLNKELRNLGLIERAISITLKNTTIKPFNVPLSHNENLRVGLFYMNQKIRVNVDVSVGSHKFHFSRNDTISIPTFDYKECIIDINDFGGLISSRVYASLKDFQVIQDRCDANNFQSFAIKNKKAMSIKGIKELYDFEWNDNEQGYVLRIPLHSDFPNSESLNHGIIMNFAKNLRKILHQAGIRITAEYLSENFLNKARQEIDKQVLKDTYDDFVNGRKIFVELCNNGSVELDFIAKELHYGNYLICVLQNEMSYIITGAILDWNYLPIKILCHEPDCNNSFELLWDTFCEEVVSIYKISIN